MGTHTLAWMLFHIIQALSPVNGLPPQDDHPFPVLVKTMFMLCLMETFQGTNPCAC